MSEQITEAKRCLIGSKTDTPCPFVATEPIPHWRTDEPEQCAYHAADDPLLDEIDEYGIALVLVQAYLKAVRKNGNTILMADLERLEKDYHERQERLRSVVDGLKAANKKVEVFRAS